MMATLIHLCRTTSLCTASTELALWIERNGYRMKENEPRREICIPHEKMGEPDAYVAEVQIAVERASGPTQSRGESIVTKQQKLLVFNFFLLTFVLGTSEFVIVGLLNDMSADLDIAISTAGGLVSVFAIAFAVGTWPSGLPLHWESFL